MYIQQTVEIQDRLPTKNEFYGFCAEVLGRTQKADFQSLFEMYMKDKNPRVETSTLEQIKTSFNYLLAYSPRVQLADINKQFGTRFTAYLEKQGFQGVTVNKHHKNIKAFLNWLYENDYTHISLAKYFKNVAAKEKNIIAITGHELELLELAKLNPRLDKARDLYLMACYTGLRYSDVVRVNSQMIHEGEIHITQEKTGQRVQIPVLSGVQRLLSKHGNDIQNIQISNQKANVYLKDLFRSLHLNRPVMNEKTGKVEPLHSAVTFHVGRKSFITLALSKGVNAKVVQSISGHKKDSVFNRYIAFASDIRIQELSKMEGPSLTVLRKAT